MVEASWVPEPSTDVTLEENWLFHLRRERFRSRASGKEHEFYVVHLADAVNVVALTDLQEVILVRQFRAGSRHDSLETPGGLIDPGEDPLKAAARELLEETGYLGLSIQVLGVAWSNPSILSSRIHTVLITGCRRAFDPNLDATEEITVELVPAVMVPRMIREGRVDHALTVGSLLRWLVSDFPGPLARAQDIGSVWRFNIVTLLWIIGLSSLVLFGLRSVVYGRGFTRAVALYAFVLLAAIGTATALAFVMRLVVIRRRPLLLHLAASEKRQRLIDRLMVYGR
jgi:8-oxo-dGTP pyrophosphatase MutT (NUDIX family)